MRKYFAQVNFTIEANDEEEANQVQANTRYAVSGFDNIVDASADEPVELDEFGHAG